MIGCSTEVGEEDVVDAAKTPSILEMDPLIRIDIKHIIVMRFLWMQRFKILIFDIYNFFFNSTVTDVDRSIGSGS